MRTAYLGTSGFAAAVLRGLAATPHRPALVVTRPDRPKGRGRRLQAPPVAEAAAELGLALVQPEDVNDPASVAAIAAAGPDAVVVCAFGAIVREPLLSLRPTYNVHPSLLPRWRGAAPIERAIMAGDAETGVSIMRLTAGLDSGPVCLAAAEPIGPEDTGGSLAERLERLGTGLLVRALDTSPAFVEQDDTAATYAEKIAAADRTVDPARPAEAEARRVRALAPHIGARIDLGDGEMLGVLAARPAAAGPPAGVLEAGPEGLRYGCTPGALELLSVQPPGGRPMDAAAYVRGRGARRAP
ncbi:MAG: methionyl-tRNA formyltransferase [Solirubrobacteraceae bacterium]